MTLFHIHPVTGTPALCRATKGRCPYDAEDAHYSSREDARAAYEARMESSNFLESVSTDTRVADEVLKLIEAQIEATYSPDARIFLKQAHSDIKRDSSLFSLSRLRVLYGDLGQDKGLDDVDLLAAARLLTTTVRKASELRAREVNIAEAQVKLASKDTYLGARLALAEYIEAAQVKLENELAGSRRLFKELQHISLNEAILKNPKAGDVLITPGHTVGIITPESEESPAGKVYVGRVQSALRERDLDELQKQASLFISGFDEEHYVPPKPGAPYPGKGFTYLDSGSESNVYLHEESQLVFKLPHNENEHDSSKEAFVAHLENLYTELDHEALAKEYNAEYVKTYFLSAKDAAGNDVGVIVQPYLSSELYAEYEPSFERETIGKLGLTDVYSQNVRVNRETKRLVLFDCFFDL